ncbi:SH3 domain-containing protein [Ornithinimicrobium murale]|uniref:SH3 domain-containing protein n=1 Tax=Ornithinimicrobium murale TaxID=1050153 RepID=UPI000E0D7720|nr:SH3 domain-containing protein [Ornithinimicrobium murale]
MFTSVDDDETDELTQEAPGKAPRKPLITKGHGRRALVLVVVPIIGIALVLFMVSLIKGLIDDSEGQDSDAVQVTESATKDEPTEPEQAKAAAQPPAESTAQVCSDVANLRAGPSTDHEVVGTVVAGDELLTTTTDADGWLQLAGTDKYISTITLCD